MAKTWQLRSDQVWVKGGMSEMDPWEAEPRTAVREPKLPGGASETGMYEESEGETPGGAEPMVCGPGAETPLVGRVLPTVGGVALSRSLGV